MSNPAEHPLAHPEQLKEGVCEHGKLIHLCPGHLPVMRDLALLLGQFGYLCALQADIPQLLAEATLQPAAGIVLDCGHLCRLPAETGKALTHLSETTPLVCLSLEGAIEARLQAVKMGCQAYITQPLDLTALLDTLDRLTSPPQAEAGKVLIIDDSASLVGFYAAHLNNAGFVTQTLTEPLKTLEVLADDLPEIILLDMNMPGATGPELARVIRQQDAYLSIPIVFLSAETDVGRQREAMSLGGDEFLQKPIKPEHLISAVRSRIIRYRALRAHMVRDSLTGLLNHTNFKERLRAEVARSKRLNKLLSVALIDIDHFKRVNDTYGHPAGDRVIKNLARLLKQRLRGADIIGRYGGEEFALALPETPIEAALTVMDAARESFANIEQHFGHATFRCSFSVGVAQFPMLLDAESLIQAADEALYSAKDAGRNQVKAHTSEAAV